MHVSVRMLSEYSHETFLMCSVFVSVVIEIVAVMTDDLSHAMPPLSFQTLLSFFYVSQPLLVYCGELIVATRSVYLPPCSRPAGAPAANTLGKMLLCFEVRSEDPQR